MGLASNHSIHKRTNLLQIRLGSRLHRLRVRHIEQVRAKSYFHSLRHLAPELERHTARAVHNQRFLHKKTAALASETPGGRTMPVQRPPKVPKKLSSPQFVRWTGRDPAWSEFRKYMHSLSKFLLRKIL